MADNTRDSVRVMVEVRHCSARVRWETVGGWVPMTPGMSLDQVKLHALERARDEMERRVVPGVGRPHHD